MIYIALVSAGMHILVALFQLCLACGAPWGEYAFGGQRRGVLPLAYRLASLFSLGLLLLFAAVNLHQAGMIHLGGFPTRAFAWITALYGILGTFVNAISRSVKERRLWTPVVATLAILNSILAWKIYAA